MKSRKDKLGLFWKVHLARGASLSVPLKDQLMHLLKDPLTNLPNRSNGCSRELLSKALEDILLFNKGFVPALSYEEDALSHADRGVDLIGKPPTDANRESLFHSVTQLSSTE